MQQNSIFPDEMGGNVFTYGNEIEPMYYNLRQQQQERSRRLFDLANLFQLIASIVAIIVFMWQFFKRK